MDLNSLTGLKFELNEKFDVHDLIPIKKTFSIENVESFDGKPFYLSHDPIREAFRITLNEGDGILQTVWIRNGLTARAIDDYLLRINPANKKVKKSSIYSKSQEISSIKNFMDYDYSTREYFIIQSANDGKRRVYASEFGF